MTTFKELGDSISPTHTDEHYQQCIDFFKDRKDSFSSAANYIIVGEKSSVEMIGRLCHADIGDAGSVPNVVLVGTSLLLRTRLNAATGKITRTEPTDAIKAYAHWLLNDSHFAHLIVNRAEHRTAEWLIEDSGGFIVSSELPQPIFQMMMILSRTFTERMQPQFDKWFELVNKGLDPHIAYNLTMCVAVGELTNNVSVNSRFGHTSMHLLNTECMKNFVKGELGKLYRKDSYRKYHSIYGCDKIFGAQAMAQDAYFVGEMMDTDSEFRERLSKFRNGDSALEGYRPPNPFAAGFKAVSIRPKQVTYQELYEVVVPYIIEKGLFKP